MFSLSFNQEHPRHHGVNGGHGQLVVVHVTRGLGHAPGHVLVAPIVLVAISTLKYATLTLVQVSLIIHTYTYSHSQTYMQAHIHICTHALPDPIYTHTHLSTHTQHQHHGLHGLPGANVPLAVVEEDSKDRGDVSMETTVWVAIQNLETATLGLALNVSTLLHAVQTFCVAESGFGRKTFLL